MQDGEDYNPFRLFTGLFIPEALARLQDLSPGSKLAFGRLARYAGENGECFPAHETLGEEIGVGERQARRYLYELEQLKLISTQRRGSTSNCYRFLWNNRVFVHHVRSDRTYMSGQTGQMCPPKRVIEESQLNINNRDDAASGEPPRLLTEEEWPLTTARVRQRFFSVDSIFMSRLIHSAVQAVCSCGGVATELTDENLDWMVLEVLKNPKIYSAGLLLTAIPQGIRNLYKSHLVSGGRK